jgi:hypothetical protein
MNRRERVRQLVMEIDLKQGELTRVQEELRLLQHEFDELVPEGPTPDGTPPKPQHPNIVTWSISSRLDPEAKTLSEKILELLDQQPREWSAAEIDAVLGHGNIDTVRTALARLSETRRIRRLSPGLYTSVNAVPDVKLFGRDKGGR